MNRFPLVSVIIPAYNASLYIKDAILSVIKQTYSNYEILIVDDGSEDETCEIVEKFAMDYNNITLIEKDHTGNVGKNSNDAIKISNGDYIAKLDSDDIWRNDKLEYQIRYIDNYKLICSNARKIDGKGNLISNGYYKFDSDMNFDLSLLLKNNYVISSTILMEKKYFLDLGGYEQELGYRGEDYILWLKAAKRNDIKFINENLIDYRIHANNLSMFSTKEKIDLQENTIRIRSAFLNEADQKAILAASEGILFALKDQCKLAFALKDYHLASSCAKEALKFSKIKFSLGYIKLLLFYIYVSTIKLLKSENKN